MGKWANGQMVKWSNGQMVKWSRAPSDVLEEVKVQRFFNIDSIQLLQSRESRM
jgi:hypothetical protein